MHQTIRSFVAGVALFGALAIAVTSIAPRLQAKLMSDQTNYKPPISGVQLDKYTAHPKRRLVIVTKLGTIKCQLFEKIAPNHVAQFSMLAKTHFYDGTTFHRVIPGFMIQGGDPNSKDDDLSNDGTGGYSKTINAEFNEVSHARGILSTARAQDPNSASSQFFIMVAPNPGLDHQYTVWGQVTDGMDVVDKIVNLPRNKQDNPGKASQITKMYVEGD